VSARHEILIHAYRNIAVPVPEKPRVVREESVAEMEFYRRDSTFRSSFRVIRKIARALEERDRPRKRARNFDS